MGDKEHQLIKDDKVANNFNARSKSIKAKRKTAKTHIR
jgi:hypothetical protein